MYFQYLKPKELSDVGQLINKGKLKEALLKLNKLEEKKDLISYDKLSCNILKSALLFLLGDYKESLMIADQACQESEELRDYLHLFDAYISKANVLVRYVWLDKALALTTKCEEILKKLSQIPAIELKKRKANLTEVKARIYLMQNEKNKVRENLKLGLKLREEIGNKYEIARSIYLMGWISWYFEFDVDKSVEITNKAFELAKKINFKFLISSVFFRLGAIYDFMGDLDRSLEYQKRSLEISKELNYKLGITQSLHLLGMVYEHKGDLDRALEYCKKALEHKEEMGDMWGISAILDTLFWMSLKKRDLKNAHHYFDRMKQLEQQGHIIINDLMLRLDKALLLKTSNLPSKQAKSKEILKEIVEKSPLFEATSRALLNLCDLLLYELRETNNLKLLNEIQFYLNQLISISKNQPSYSLMAEAHLLQSNLALLTLDLKRAQESITQAQHIAEKYGLNQLAEKISIEQDELLNQTSRWEALRNSKATIAELINLVHFDEHLTHMLRKRYF